MAYVITKKPTFPVKGIEIHTQDDGRWVKETLDARFLRKSTEDLDRLKHLKPAEVVREVLDGLTGLKDEQGADVPFSRDDEALFESILAAPPLVAALVRAFWANQVKASEKN